MAKGGSRVPSDSYAVGKGMGLDRHYELLSLMQADKTITAKDAITILNKKFAWWDDPNDDGPTETCRSYLKELWRLGILDRVSASTKKSIRITPDTWAKGERPATYKISDLGKFILSQHKDLFPFYIGWCIIDALKKNIYPQVDKLLRLSSIYGNIPINDDETVRLTKKYNIYVEKHAGKAIKFGWLEPTGIIYRSSTNCFTANNNYITYLAGVNINELFNDIQQNINHNNEIEAEVIPKSFILTSFASGTKYPFKLLIKNKTNNAKTLNISPSLLGLFENISKIYVRNKISLNPLESKYLDCELESNAVELSDSLMPLKIGMVSIQDKSNSLCIYLPAISIMNQDHIWELELCQLFRRLDLSVFHLTGKSDRPDAVIDLSELKNDPDDLLAYLRDNSREKMLMETTLGEYGPEKLSSDTIKKNTRGLNKYETHTKHVLKIVALGQIIAADKFANGINHKFDIIKKETNHLITLIDKGALEYLIQKYNNKKNKQKVITLLKSGQRISKELIDTIFN